MSSKVQLLYEGRHLRLLKDGRWEYVQRLSNRGAVFVLAVTREHELILVEQFRVPLQARTLEMPAGILGDEAAYPDESPESCALRELEEEAGYRGGKARLLMSGPVAPGLTSEILYMVLAEDLTRVNAGGGVDGEDITVHTVPLERVRAWLEQQRKAGLLIEPRIYAGLYWLSTRS
jgi:ADP-ribose pyrophosphatase